MAVAPWVVSDELWERIEPLLPRVERRFRYPGRKRLPDRQALQGILFVLHTGIAWRHLPLELGFGGGSTCYTAYSDISRQLRLPRYPVVSCDTAHSLATPAPTSRMGRSSLQRAEGKLPWTDATSSVEVMTKATASLGFRSRSSQTRPSRRVATRSSSTFGARSVASPAAPGMRH